MRSRAALKRLGRLRRKTRVQKKQKGGTQHPRLCVFRSLKHLSAQIINDESGMTLLSLTTTSKEFASQSRDLKGKVAMGELLGRLLARKALEQGIEKIRFDRGGYAYHGRVRAIAEGARKGGLEF